MGAFPFLTGSTSCILQEFLTIFVSVLTALLIPFLGTDLGSAFAAGAMLYVVFGELLPESVKLWQSRLPALAAVLGIILGMVITLGQG